MADTRVHAALLALTILSAGCLGGTFGASSNDTTTTPTPTVETTAPTPGTPPTARWTERDGPNGYPDPPTNLTNQSAKQVVWQYEGAFIENSLAASDVDDYGFGGVATAETTVVERADGGIYVHITRGYWWERVEWSKVDGTSVAEKSIADLTSEATYFVSTETIRRVDGTDVRV